MTLFVDASALIAIIAAEDECAPLLQRMAEDDDNLWSPLSCWEAISGLRHSHSYILERAIAEVEAFATNRPLRLVTIGEQERVISLGCYQQFGRGSGHPAKLNFGDCFAYACAKTNNAQLLYKGDDFAKTDLA